MKTSILSAAVVFLVFSAEIAMACCYTNNLYFVTNVKKHDSLNVRQEPHPLSPIVGTLKHNQRYLLLESYRDKDEEMHSYDLCVTVDFSPFEGRRTVSKWCQLREPKGWVNMHYLDHCEVESGDGGNIISSQCSDIIKGKKVADYLFRSKQL